jgi:hypothetical protein
MEALFWGRLTRPQHVTDALSDGGYTSRPKIQIKKTIHATIAKALVARIARPIRIPARDTADPSPCKTGSWIIGCIR